jgi:hypothetical protein
VADHNPVDESWEKLHGQEFTPQEVRDARDFHDVAGAYCLDTEMLTAFMLERKLRVGHRLYLAMTLQPDQLGVLCLKDLDDRVVKVAKARCGELDREKDGRTSILLPGEKDASIQAQPQRQAKPRRGQIIVP